jgi:hypothetical protein
MGTAMFAAPINPITVNLPHSVTVGSITLPVGQYVITSFEMGGEDLFVVRGEHTTAVTLRGVRVDSESADTKVTFSKDGDNWRFDKLTVAGESEAFQFLNAK